MYAFGVSLTAEKYKQEATIHSITKSSSPLEKSHTFALGHFKYKKGSIFFAIFILPREWAQNPYYGLWNFKPIFCQISLFIILLNEKQNTDLLFQQKFLIPRELWTQALFLHCIEWFPSPLPHWLPFLLLMGGSIKQSFLLYHSRHNKFPSFVQASLSGNHHTWY